ncbi:MAG: phage tail protein [Lachnospiraceae bacterium]|nr:phage tail protein [Lachnospiraceae bacterium]
MTVNEIIKKALTPFGIPITADFFGGGAKEYFTFNYADDRAAGFGDDEPLQVVAYMQIHYFAPMEKDYLSIKKKIRKALFNAGFTYPDVTDATVLSDGIRHLVFECEIENEDELSEI